MITIYDRLDGLDTTDLEYDTVQNGIKERITSSQSLCLELGTEGSEGK